MPMPKVHRGRVPGRRGQDTTEQGPKAMTSTWTCTSRATGTGCRCRTAAVNVTMTVTLMLRLALTKTELRRLKKARSRREPGRTYRRGCRGRRR